MTTSLPASARPASPLGLHRVLDPPGVLPQAAWRLDPSPVIAPDEVRVRVDRLNLDAASYRQLHEAHPGEAVESSSKSLKTENLTVLC